MFISKVIIIDIVWPTKIDQNIYCGHFNFGLSQKIMFKHHYHITIKWPFYIKRSIKIETPNKILFQL